MVLNGIESRESAKSEVVTIRDNARSSDFMRDEGTSRH
jgi:hypothetical protein